MMHRLIAGALAAAALSTQAVAADNSLLGQSEPANAGERTIVVTPETDAVNVRHGEVIRFVVGDKSFSWGFTEPATISVIDLNAIAPAGTFSHPVRAYIKRIPIYDGG